MDLEELALFEQSVRRAAATGAGDDLDRALFELGWADALADDPRSAISVVFETQGELNATSSAIEDVIMRELRLEDALGRALVLPSLTLGDPPGVIERGRVTVRGIATRALLRCDTVAVPAIAGHVNVVALIEPAALERRPVKGIDPASGLYEVSAHSVGTGEGMPFNSVDWEAALAKGRLAISHELVGVQRQMLRLARDHATGRIQFGRPISAFQAVRHRLSESLVAVESAHAALGAAWDHPSQFTASVAKAIAGRNSKTVVRHCQQVLAGVGFTASHPFHRYLRRSLVLDGLLGSSRVLSRQIGEELLRTRRLPGALPL
ncbi:MAG: acyl-CoA dehydrogenase family protein [Acidimicrobiales bacterium]